MSLDSDFSVVAFARTLATFLDATGIERAHLVCHSLGGQVCIAFALDFARRVETLTVLDAAGTYAQEEFIQRMAKQGGRFNTGGIRLERNAAMSMLLGGDLDIVRRLVADDPTLLTTLASFRDNYRRRVRDIAAPTLIIWGEEDPLFPIDYGVFLKENIRGSILRVVPGAAHTPQLSDPDLVLRWVEEFQKGAST